VVKETANLAFDQNRAQNRDELKYSLRSVQQFAPWIRHVFIVTNGQTPSWLNTSNHRITVVNTDVRIHM